ncbi:NAD(P)/FAD-dependent oxidoreductase, partial [Streptomyces sp. NPDC060031]
AATGRGDLDKSLVAYARRHRRQLRGHQSLAADYAKARPFNPGERLMFSAAARDEPMARHIHLFASRLIGPLRFLNPVALAKAAVVNIKHRGATRGSGHAAGSS